MAHQDNTGRRSLHAAAIAFEQRHAKRGLHAGDAFADRGERKVHGLRALREAAAFDDRQEKPHIDQVKTHASALL
jgi:hypothetical protein